MQQNLPKFEHEYVFPLSAPIDITEYTSISLYLEVEKCL